MRKVLVVIGRLSALSCGSSTRKNFSELKPSIVLLRDHRHEQSVIPSECERPGGGFLCEPEKVF
jgi:hypothetical protein